SQLVRSRSLYYRGKVYKIGKRGFSATVIPNRGALLEYETDAKDVVYVRIERSRKLPVSVLFRALGCGSDHEITELLGDN
ncbi:hypothetical protein NPM09_33905, partial [Bacillus cereus]|uniref:hypothetical protein n=1 Tax=Bacillus cereus TaxID=1396 RepID=UPI002112A3B5